MPPLILLPEKTGSQHGAHIFGTHHVVFAIRHDLVDQNEQTLQQMLICSWQFFDQLTHC